MHLKGGYSKWQTTIIVGGGWEGGGASDGEVLSIFLIGF